MTDGSSTEAESPTVVAALALPRALERGDHGESLRQLYTDDATSTEYPSRVAPRGGTHGVEEILAASDAGAGLLQRQTYDIHEVIESGDQVIFRYTWTGVIGVERGPFRPGQELVAHVAAFATIRDGKIARWQTYDCYEPF